MTHHAYELSHIEQEWILHSPNAMSLNQCAHCKRSSISQEVLPHVLPCPCLALPMSTCQVLSPFAWPRPASCPPVNFHSYDRGVLLWSTEGLVLCNIWGSKPMWQYQYFKYQIYRNLSFPVVWDDGYHAGILWTREQNTLYLQDCIWIVWQKTVS